MRTGANIPIFDFSCNSCDSYFSISIQENTDLDFTVCPNCGKKDFDCHGYDLFSSDRLTELFKKISTIEWRIMKLEEGVDTEDEENKVDTRFN